MSTKELQNFYKTTILQSWTDGTGIAYVVVKPTVSSGFLVVNPSSETLREIVSYSATGTDGIGDYVTLDERGLGGTTAQTHVIGEPVRMNFTSKHWDELLKLDTSDDTFDADSKKIKNVATPTDDSDASTKKYIDDIAIAGSPDASETTKGISKLSTSPASPTDPIAVGDNDTRLPTQDENDSLVGTSGTPSSSNKYVTNDDTDGTGLLLRNDLIVKNFIKGGTGVDGALTITSGTTNIDLGGVAVFVKNYSSISITGTGALTFSNPHANGTTIIFLNTGDTTITSSAVSAISLVGIGASGGDGGGDNSNGTDGTPNSVINQYLISGTNATFGIKGNAGGDQGGAASAASVNNTFLGTSDDIKYLTRELLLKGFTGAGGGGGGGGKKNDGTIGSGGAGGRGGGSLVILGLGTLNFSGTINAKGSDGAIGGARLTGTAACGGSGGGGGGAGGFIGIITSSITSNTGIILVTGGGGGNGGNASSGGGNGGGGSGASGGANLLYSGGAGGRGGEDDSPAGADGSNGTGTYPGIKGTAGTGGGGNYGVTNSYGAGGGGGGGASGFYFITSISNF